jgi:cytochrome c oxidase assembly protein subunit 11
VTREEFIQKLNASLLGKLTLVAVLMFGFGYGLIPVYKAICELTGVNILTAQEELIGHKGKIGNTQVDSSRTITVEFDANSSGPWRFRPVKSSIQVHPGELAQVVYEVVNKENRKIEAQAIASYAPQAANPYFKKVECFCFKQQTLGPNEAKQMPVVFFIDPALPKNVNVITLSYTFFEISGLGNKPGFSVVMEP